MKKKPSKRPKFQQQAKLYDQATPIQTLVAKQLAENIKPYLATLPPNFHCMDIGCGTGKLTLAFLQQIDVNQNILCYGIDNADNMLSLWQKNCQQFLSKNKINIQLLPVYQDFTQPFAIKSAIHLCISSFALHWGKPDNLLHLLSMLTVNGQAHLAIPVMGSLGDVKQKFPLLPIYPFVSADIWQKQIAKIIAPYHGGFLYFYQEKFSFCYQNLRELLINLNKMGGTISQQSSIRFSTLAQYLQTTQPVNLDYQVLFVGIKMGKINAN